MDSLVNLTNQLRRKRGFHVEKYISDKLLALGTFFKHNCLDAVVVPISGGVDSAIVLAFMYDLAWKGYIKKVLPIFIPIEVGTSQQGSAMGRARELCERFNFPFYVVDGTPATRSIIGNSMIVQNNKYWGFGQLASIVRTPIIYYHAALLQNEGYRSIVVGTTNRDEGCYIGFYGKASDGMNDLQPIADLHKSEVYQVAKYYEIPQSIIDVSPKGDVWDARCDEEMIGAPYWFLELYILAIEYGFVERLTEDHTQEDLNQILKWIENIENLHKVNIHKYRVGHPAHFVDVMPRKILGGWQ